MRTKFPPLDTLLSINPSFVSGTALQEIKRIERSILMFGLLTPLYLTQSLHGTSVIDGKKRLMALKRLKFQGRLPRSLHTLPIIMMSDTDLASPSNTSERLLSNSDMFRHIARLCMNGVPHNTIAKDLYLSKDEVGAYLSVPKLSSKLHNMFHRDLLSLTQVQALATVPEMSTQDRVMEALGPHANAQTILDHIINGAVVLNLDDEDNALILPSRAPLERAVKAENPAKIKAKHARRIAA